jgi:glycosyltransferase involved in cell wall biosynthesis
MKVLHVSTDISSGSGRGAFELHRQLLAAGVESSYFSALYNEHPETVELAKKNRLLSKVLPRIERALAKRYRAADTPIRFSISPDWLHTDLESVMKSIGPNIIHLHWVWTGVMSPGYARHISEQVPVVWTLRDMNLLTGGCHYAGPCRRWKQSCGKCPLLHSTNPKDISHRQLAHKEHELLNSSITLLATSRRMHALAMESRLSKLVSPEIIPISINTTVFSPRSKHACREALGLDPDRRYVLFSGLFFTRQAYKGWDFLLQLLCFLGESREWTLLLVGDDAPHLHQIPKTISYGRIMDSLSLSVIYSAANVTIMPSTEESFGKVAAESLACGTPVILAQEVGAAEFIDHGETGWIFDQGDQTAAIAGINHLLARTEISPDDTSRKCHSVAAAFGAPTAQAHIALYEQIIASQNKR